MKNPIAGNLPMKELRKTIFDSVLCLFILGLFLSLGSSCPANAQQIKPLTYPEIITALNTKLPNAVFKNKPALINWLIIQIKQRRVDKALTKETEEFLRQSGGTDELISVIREQAPPIKNPFNNYRWDSIAGNWEFSDESLLQTNELSKPALIVAQNINLSSYILTFKARRTKGVDAMSIIFNFQDRDNYVYWHLGNSYNNILINGIPGNKAVLEYTISGNPFYWNASAVPLTLQENRWYDIKVVVNGNQVKGFIDNELKLNMELPKNLPTNGSFGFRSWNIKAEFKDLKIEILR